MNIDVEGHEIFILKTLNLKKFKVKYFCIEILTYNNCFTKYLVFLKKINISLNIFHI